MREIRLKIQQLFEIDPQNCRSSDRPGINHGLRLEALRVFAVANRCDAGRGRRSNLVSWDDGNRFVVHADDKLTAFIELERAIHQFAVDLIL